MAGLGTVHQRSSSHQHPKKTQTSKTSRPAILVKRWSGHNVPRTSQSSIRAAVRREDDDDDAMAGSFLQFCTVCEGQIIVPNNNILYCSESCRRKDSSDSHTHPSLSNYTPPHSPHGAFSPVDLPTHDIVPQRTPTARRPSSGYFSDLSDDDFLYDTPYLPRVDSEAARSLKQFFTTPSTGSTPRVNVRSKRDISGTQNDYDPPHSPSSTSSLVSNPPFAAAASRPLPPIRKPTSFRPHSIELVIPFDLSSGPPTAPPSLPSSHHRNSSSSTSLKLKAQPVTKTSSTTGKGELRWCEKHQMMHLPGEFNVVSSGLGNLSQLLSGSEGERSATPRATAAYGERIMSSGSMAI